MNHLRSKVRDLIELEVFLFQSVPERPNPVYGRDSFANVISRTSREAVNGRGTTTGNVRDDSSELDILGEMVIDYANRSISFSPFASEASDAT